LYSLPPLYSDKKRTVGHLLNVFTRQQYRGRGFATGPIEFIKQAASQKNISQLFLNSTQAGYMLYKNCGFAEPHNAAMVLEIPQITRYSTAD
jgi:N-acetylglutamate synthase-like GNAT family acetyltransferase